MQSSTMNNKNSHYNLIGKINFKRQRKSFLTPGLYWVSKRLVNEYQQLRNPILNMHWRLLPLLHGLLPFFQNGFPIKHKLCRMPALHEQCSQTFYRNHCTLLHFKASKQKILSNSHTKSDFSSSFKNFDIIL